MARLKVSNKVLENAMNKAIHVTEHNVTERDVTERDVTERDVTEQNVTEHFLNF